MPRLIVPVLSGLRTGIHLTFAHSTDAQVFGSHSINVQFKLDAITDCTNSLSCLSAAVE